MELSSDFGGNCLTMAAGCCCASDDLDLSDQILVFN